MKDEEYCGEIKVALIFTLEKNEECYIDQGESYGGWKELINPFPLHRTWRQVTLNVKPTLDDSLSSKTSKDHLFSNHCWLSLTSLVRRNTYKLHQKQSDDPQYVEIVENNKIFCFCNQINYRSPDDARLRIQILVVAMIIFKKAINREFVPHFKVDENYTEIHIDKTIILIQLKKIKSSLFSTEKKDQTKLSGASQPRPKIMLKRSVSPIVEARRVRRVLTLFEKEAREAKTARFAAPSSGEGSTYAFAPPSDLPSLPLEDTTYALVVSPLRIVHPDPPSIGVDEVEDASRVQSKPPSGEKAGLFVGLEAEVVANDAFLYINFEGVAADQAYLDPASEASVLAYFEVVVDLTLA
ncbi:hypothetical protein Fmac_001802 [Flemingia macrophylla]|uniref:Uncharacterized protein n=1 Tax=Flemingia macrophylla TaxID=520843 RepID=A0ABD1NI45_9FABA